MAMDRFTFLRQLGYYGSLAEMEAKYAQNTTRLDTVGEQVYFALDQADARAALGVTAGGGAPVSPSDLVPSLGNVDNTSDVNKPVSTLQQAALNLKADQTALNTTNGNVSTLSTTVAGKAAQTSLDTTNANVTSLTTTVGTKATDTAVVHNTGTETVGGVKTFTLSPIVPTPTTSGQAVPKSYVDGQLSNTYAIQSTSASDARNFSGGGAIPSNWVVTWYCSGAYTPTNALAIDVIQIPGT